MITRNETSNLENIIETILGKDASGNERKVKNLQLAYQFKV